MRSLDRVGALILGLAMTGEAVAEAPSKPTETVSFRRDVMPVFFRAGCNSGGCHGAARGKDGFRLSLFGYDPDGDYFRLTQQVVGRRVDVASPEQSLLLAKAAGKVTHTGGQLFREDSPHYRTLLRWIEAGAPTDAADVPEAVAIAMTPARMVFDGDHRGQAMTVLATYSDGSTRDVTTLARFSTNNATTATIDDDGRVQAGRRGDTFVFARFNRFTIGAEVVVLPTESGFRWPDVKPFNYIDDLVFARLQKLHLAPSDLCTDEQYLRRAYLDLIGLPPTIAEYRRFLADPAPDRRTRLVDELLKRDEFADLWAAKWGEALKILGVGYTPHASDEKAAEAYHEWIRDQIARNAPLDEFVRAQLTSKGSNLVDGPVNLYTSLPQSVKFVPKDFAQDFAQLFTGIRIQCAECHNHPFDRWTMDDYYGLVSCFTGLTRKPGSEPREFFIYNDPAAPPARHLLDDRPVPARVLGGLSPVPSGQDPRVALADWLTDPANPYFARNLANRIWAHFLGRGIIEPVDDLRVSNPPSNGELLDGLADHLVRSKFDLRALARDICTSRTYQASVVPNATNADDDRQFSRGTLRRLRSDVLLDAFSQVTGAESRFDNFPGGTRAVQYYPRIGSPVPTAGSYFLQTFGRSPRATVCACETRSELTLSQALHLIGGEAINAKLAEGKFVPALIKAGPGPSTIVEGLYLRALSRKPTPDELRTMLGLVGDRAADRQAYDDILWGLLTSSEFQFNH
jgi:hypothetical protein